MKKAAKIVKLLIIIILVILLSLISVSYFMQDKVADIILKSLNKTISTRLEIRTFDFSLLKKFPQASFELKDVVIYSSANNSNVLTDLYPDTLLSAKTMSVEFKITDLIRGNYDIERIGFKSGEINLYADTSGLINYDISTIKKSKNSDEDVTINLEKITLTNTKTSYFNGTQNLLIKGIIKEGKLKSRISGKNIDFTAASEISITGFRYKNFIINKPVETSVDLDFQKSEDVFLFSKGDLHIENYDFFVEGAVSDQMLDLKITGMNIDVKSICNYLPEKYYKITSEYTPSGLLNLDCRIKDFYPSILVNPHWEIDFHIKDGHMNYGKSDIAVNDLTMTGHYSNGIKNCKETSSVSVSKINGNLGSSTYSGNYTISDFSKPETKLVLKGRLYPEEIKKFFDLKTFSASGGYLDFNINTPLDITSISKLKLSEIIDMRPETNVDFYNCDLGFKNGQVEFEDITGNLSSAGNLVRTKQLQFTYKGQKINTTGEFINLPEWLTDRPVIMTAVSDVTFDRLILKSFFSNPNSSAAGQEKKPFDAPDNLNLNINFKIDSINYKTFSSSDISGSFTYRENILTFKTFDMKSLDGLISGNGFIFQNTDRSLMSRGNFNVKEIDVNKAFTTFGNFGQEFIKAENLAGKLSGSFSIILPFDPLFHPQMKSLTAEGKYLLVNGGLINFEPVKKLSSFIELSELENISFDKLENDFFIRNNVLKIPQMEIKSSAVDLSANGQHGFDNNYEYHVKVLLSEILSKKRKKNRKNNISEFGAVEDDGLGRTSILLKIENKGDEVKVGYDLKAAGNKIKEDIKSEKKTLKNILNQEYGWYKDDTTLNRQQDEKRKFNVTWE